MGSRNSKRHGFATWQIYALKTFSTRHSVASLLKLGPAVVCLLALWAPSLVLAQTGHISQHEGFSYPDGDLLNGKSGGHDIAGYWDGNWSGDTFFTVQDGRVEIGMSGATGGQGDPPNPTIPEKTISRLFEMQLDTPYHPNTGDDLFFHVQLTEDGDNAEEFAFGIAFDDGGTPTARIGIQEASTGVARYYAGLGSSNFLVSDGSPSALGTTQNLEAFPNQSHYISGKIEFNVDGGSNERLSIWVDEVNTFQAMQSTQPVIEILTDIGTDTLGDQVSLDATTTNTNTALTKTVDDLWVSFIPPNSGFVKYDLGPNGQSLKTGFSEWNLDDADPFTETFDLHDFGFWGVSRDLTMTLNDINGDPLTAGDIDDISGGSGGIDPELRTDGLSIDGGFSLTFDGLLNDPWILKVFHHFDGNETDPASGVEVSVDENNDGTIDETFSITFETSTEGTDPNGLDRAEHSDILFHANGTDPVTVYFTPTGGGSELPINGFALVPEPSSFALISLGLIGVLGAAWRARTGRKA